MFSKSGKILLALSAVLAMLISALAGCSSGGAAGATATVTVTQSAGGAAMANLVVYGDMVSNIGCLEISLGHRGELVVFRIRVVDPKTGKDMIDTDLKSVSATLPDGKKFDLTYGGHPGGATPTDWFWSAPWEIPLTYPTGTLGYKVDAVANDGRTGTFSPFLVSSSLLTIKEFDVAFVAGKSTNITATGFSVTNIIAAQGAKVTFNNKDTVTHTVVGDGWTSGPIDPGKNYARVFDKAGSFNFKDAANAGFTGTVTVNAP